MRRATALARRRLVPVVVGAMLVIAGGPTAAVPDPGGAPLAPAAACPAHEAVLAALRKLGARDDPDRLATLALDAELVIADLGSRFRVSVAGRTRDYEDAARDCDRRARLGAVFAALVLAPGGPTAEASAEAAVSVPPATPAPATLPPSVPLARPAPEVVVSATPPPDSGAWFEVAAAAAMTLAPHRGAGLTSAGVSLGVARRGPTWSLGMTLVVPVTAAALSIGGTAVELARYPLRLVVARTLVAIGRLRATAQAGGVLSMLRVERTGPPPTANTTRFEPGAHAGAELELAADRGLSGFLGFSSDWIPKTHPLTLDPEGEVDRTPALWFSGLAGLRLTFH